MRLRSRFQASLRHYGWGALTGFLVVALLLPQMWLLEIGTAAETLSALTSDGDRLEHAGNALTSASAALVVSSVAGLLFGVAHRLGRAMGAYSHRRIRGRRRQQRKAV